jgi:CMP-N-acetylneuraminic acid synthetase
LLEYTADSALAARRLSRVVLSTEDPEVADAGRRCGLEIPFMRPADLAQDATPSLAVVQHALRWLETRGDRYDAVCLLEPTAPFRGPDEIDGCIALLEESGADAVITVRCVPDEFNPHWTYLRDARGYLRLSTGEGTPVPRRQSLPPAYHRDGSVYVTRRDVVLDRNSLYGDRLVGYVVHDRPWVNIDTAEDWARAEELIVARAS